MATSNVSRLAPVTARDGVDTRNKDLTLCPLESIKGVTITCAAVVIQRWWARLSRTAGECMVCGCAVDDRRECVCQECQEREEMELRYELADMERLEDDFCAEEPLEEEYDDDFCPDDGSDGWDRTPVYNNATHKMHEGRRIVNVLYGSAQKREATLREEEVRVRMALEKRRLEVARLESPSRQQTRCKDLKADLMASAFHPTRVEAWLNAASSDPRESAVLDMMFGY